jgi:hypothetical protein
VKQRWKDGRLAPFWLGGDARHSTDKIEGAPSARPARPFDPRRSLRAGYRDSRRNGGVTLRPQIVMAVAVRDFDARAKDFRQLSWLENLFFPPIRNDLAAAHQKHA